MDIYWSTAFQPLTFGARLATGAPEGRAIDLLFTDLYGRAASLVPVMQIELIYRARLAAASGTTDGTVLAVPGLPGCGPDRSMVIAGVPSGSLEAPRHSCCSSRGFNGVWSMEYGVWSKE